MYLCAYAYTYEYVCVCGPSFAFSPERDSALGTGDSPQGTIVLIVALDIFYAVKLTQKDLRICLHLRLPLSACVYVSVRVCECVERY